MPNLAMRVPSLNVGTIFVAVEFFQRATAIGELTIAHECSTVEHVILR